MAILDIFKRKEDEYYKGYKLSSDVDNALQKQLIDRGRGQEVNTLTPEAVAQGNKMMNVTANSTPAMIVGGKNSLAPEPIAQDVKLDVLEKTVGWANKVDEVLKR